MHVEHAGGPLTSRHFCMALEPESAALFVAEIITPVPLLKENVVLPHTWFASESAVKSFFK